MDFMEHSMALSLAAFVALSSCAALHVSHAVAPNGADLIASVKAEMRLLVSADTWLRVLQDIGPYVDPENDMGQTTVSVGIVPRK
jgi:hypothetical protein